MKIHIANDSINNKATIKGSERRSLTVQRHNQEKLQNMDPIRLEQANEAVVKSRDSELRVQRNDEQYRK